MNRLFIDHTIEDNTIYVQLYETDTVYSVKTYYPLYKKISDNREII